MDRAAVEALVETNPMSGIPKTVWLTIAWALVALAAMLCAWGWHRARSLRRKAVVRRCPRCWHDMRHTDGRRCPECGRTASRERDLFRCRRRWWPAAFAFVLVLAAAPVARTPAMLESGWTGGVPNLVLCAAFPWMDRHLEATRDKSAPSTLDRATEALMNELMFRCARDRLDAWHWRTLLWRVRQSDPERLWPRTDETGERVSRTGSLLHHARMCSSLDPKTLAWANDASHITFDLGGSWPAGATIWARLRFDHWDRSSLRATIVHRETGHVLDRVEYVPRSDSIRRSWLRGLTPTWDDDQIALVAASDQLEHIPLTVIIDVLRPDGAFGVHLRTYDVDLPVDVVPADTPLVTPVQAPAATATIQDTTSASWNPAHDASLAIVNVAFGGASRSALIEAGIDIVAARFEFLDASETVIGSGRAWWVLQGTGPQFTPGRTRAAITIELDRPIPSAPDAAHRLRIVSDPTMALRVFPRSTYWEGSVTIPLRFGW